MTPKLIIPSCFGFFVFLIFISCNSKQDSLTQRQSAEVNESVQNMMQLLAKDISHNGPIAWLKYFENTPDFFMASDGQLVFRDNNSATTFIQNTLVKQIRKIELHWSDIRIDPMTSNFANIAATWNEDITDSTDNKTSQRGYFTAVAEKSLQGSQLRNAHWSVAKSK